MTEFFIVWTAVSDLSAVRVTVTGGLASSGEKLSGRGERGERLTAVSAGVLRPAGEVEVLTTISQEPTLGVAVTVMRLACRFTTAATAGLGRPAL